MHTGESAFKSDCGFGSIFRPLESILFKRDFRPPQRPATPNVEKLTTLSNTQLGMLSGDKRPG